MVQVVQIRCKLHLWGMLVQWCNPLFIGVALLHYPCTCLHPYFGASE